MIRKNILKTKGKINLKHTINIILIVLFLIIILIMKNLNKRNIYKGVIVNEIKEDEKEIENIVESVNNQVPQEAIESRITVNCFEENFTDLIAEYETKFNEQNINRSTNIKLATSNVNGTIILPEEVFSYNDIVGNRTETAGFKSAPMYLGGEIVNGIGGGVCQVSSTLYNAVLYANLEVIERKNHQFLPAYISAGRDASVADEYIDFKFKNTRKYPVKIVCNVQNGILQVEIYGRKEDVEYDIEIQTVIKECIPYKTTYEYDNNMKSGDYKIVQNGKNGYESRSYKITKLNGEILSKVIISTDRYNAVPEIIKMGTRK